MSNTLSCQVKLFHDFKLKIDESFYHALESIRSKSLQEDYLDHEYDLFTSINLDLNEETHVQLDIILQPLGFKLKALFIPTGGNQSTDEIYSLTEALFFESSKEVFKLSFEPGKDGLYPATKYPTDDILYFYGIKEEDKCPCCPDCNEPIKEAGIIIITNRYGKIDEDSDFIQEDDEEFIRCCNCDYQYDYDELNELFDYNLRLY